MGAFFFLEEDLRLAGRGSGPDLPPLRAGEAALFFFFRPM